MSRRPMRGQPNPGRGGDGRRRLYSESPIARVGVRKVRAAAAAPPLPCAELSLPAGDAWGRVTFTSTGATFDYAGTGGGFDASSFNYAIGVGFDLTATGDVDIRAKVFGSDDDGGVGTTGIGAWSDWATITGPSMAGDAVIPTGGTPAWSINLITGIELEWDTAGAFTAVCPYVYIFT